MNKRRLEGKKKIEILLPYKRLKIESVGLFNRLMPLKDVSIVLIVLIFQGRQYVRE